MSTALLLAMLSIRPDAFAQLRPQEPGRPSMSFTIKADGVVLTDLPSDQILRLAEVEFDFGRKFQHDASKALPSYREAARMYDEVWRRGYRDANLALNRANAHRLGGDLPGAILALKQGLAAARWSRPLQVALEDARAAVAYPAYTDLAALCRPVAPRTIGTRMSPFEARLIVAILGLLICCSVARFVMTLSGWWMGFAVVWIVVLGTLGALWFHDDRVWQRENEYPLVVVAEDVNLRKGNADAYPLRLEGSSKLPKGVEARELARRGGWVHIRLAGGVLGWIPETSVLKIAG